jgi:hypothetical protein
MTTKLRELYTTGVDTKTIAEQLSIKPSQVRNKALYMGYTRPDNYQQKRIRHSIWKTPGMTEKLTQLYSKEGLHVDDIAEKFNLPPEKIWGKITHLGLHRPRNHHQKRRTPQQQDTNGRYLHQEPGKPKPHIPIPTEWNGNGTITLNLYNLIEAWNKDLDYTYTNLPPGVTVDVMDTKIRNGEWSLL